ncbi:putative signal-transduction protein containing cAMP-binding and CBS domains [Candidatus Halobonum tyrrellensis G22]|uniref:Putative signal-transduction protein containing cAMP-binding and CBS domains n=2 Tax=Candidatus Halobonum TaxID=1431544 RepID=V4HH97_9EURY|nr:putative signal-transduction protein containing cAMP-binding and CBS domains [Candidatus Halobonum tyrrellensis G22]
MREDVVTASPDAPVTEVATEMRDENVGSVVVVESDAPVGLVTDRDIAVRIAADGLDADEMTAEGVMTEDPLTVERDTGVFELCATMDEEDVRRMPVVDGGDLVGIVTLDDLIRLLTDELTTLTGVIEAESPSY